MMKRNFILFLLTAIGYTGWTQTSITGVAATFPNQKIYAYQLSDALCQVPHLLATAVTNEQGEFKFALALPELSELSLRVGDATGHLWCEPNKHYSITFLQEDLSQTQNALTHAWDIRIAYNENDLNSLMYAFDEDYTTFITNNYYDYMLLSSSGNAATKQRIAKQNPKDDLTHAAPTKDSASVEKTSSRFLKATLQFEKDMHAKYGDFEKTNSFFADYIFSRIKEIRYTTLHIVNEIEFEKHFQNNNPACTDLLEMMSEYYLRPPLTAIQREQLDNLVSVEHQSKKIIEFLKFDSLHVYDPMNELMLAAALRQGFYSNLYKKQDIEWVLKDLAKEAKNSKAKELAEHVLAEINFYKELRSISNFEGTDAFGNKWVLDKNANRYFYIYFFDSSLECQRDLAYLNNLADLYYKDIHFVCVGMQKRKNEFDLITQKFDNRHLTFLYTGMDQELMLAFRLKILPTAYFANKNKELVLNYTPLPTEGIERKFQQTLLRSKK